MKAFIMFCMALVFSTVSFASGKFIFKPEQNYTKKTTDIEMGVSIHQKVLGPLYVTNWSGVTFAQKKEQGESEFTDADFKVGVGIQPIDKLQVEVGYEWQKNLISHYGQDIGYLKIGAQLW